MFSLESSLAIGEAPYRAGYWIENRGVWYISRGALQPLAMGRGGVLFLYFARMQNVETTASWRVVS